LFDYVVKDGDTFYSLTKSADVTQEQLVQMNPELSDGLREGMTIKIPVDLSATRSVTTKNISDLTATLSKKNKKHLVLMIPFNVAKIEMDSLKSLNSKFKDDKFLNMTLDFYSGALMAIDSAKTLGLNVDVSIFDSEETKNTTSAIATLEEKAPDASAVIGPFFQANVEKVAAALEGKNIPVISPLSKDDLKSNSNLFNSMPSEDFRKKAIFEYMNGKNGTIIAIVEPEKAEVSQFIKSNYSNVQWVGLSAKNTFVSDSIKKHLVKNKTNFVVMESEKYYTIQTTISALLSAMKDFTVQLVVIEPNKMLDFEEISLNNLIKLKLTYPSLIKEIDSPKGMQFEKEYRKINKVTPNQFAIRGFDVTFDALLRLSQEASFEETAQATASEHVESKFEYAKISNGGYQNKGVYILTYQPDLTIKQAQ
jgi:LysM domain